MMQKVLLSVLLLTWLPTAWSTLPNGNARMIGAGDIAAWIGALCIVLALFYLCVWLMRKVSGLHGSHSGKMRVIDNLALGVREKVVLVQVGSKQLVLGVTPGKIEALHVLEGDDCLPNTTQTEINTESGFAQKLLQAIKTYPHA